LGYSIWQRNYWKHVIYSETEYARIAGYVCDNPVLWGEFFLYLLLYTRSKKMTAAAMLMREIETLPEESIVEALDYIIFLKSKPFEVSKPRRISIEDAHGIFKDLKGMDTTIEREDDRI
jgi:hypothetical protein